jgi:hypothetical protein
MSCETCDTLAQDVANLRAELWALDNEGAYIGVPMPAVEGWTADEGIAIRELDHEAKKLNAYVEGSYSNGFEGEAPVWTWQWSVDEPPGVGFIADQYATGTAATFYDAITAAEKAAAEVIEEEERLIEEEAGR